MIITTDLGQYGLTELVSPGTQIANDDFPIILNSNHIQPNGSNKSEVTDRIAELTDNSRYRFLV